MSPDSIALNDAIAERAALDLRIADTLGVDIEIGDTVTVTAWGSPVRQVDCGRSAKVVGFTRAGNVILDNSHLNEHDPIAGGRAVRPGCLAVARRDGLTGHEGNR